MKTHAFFARPARIRARRENGEPFELNEPVNLVHRPNPAHRLRPRAIFAALLALLSAVQLFAHDIPADTTVRAFIKPQGQRLQLLVRVPMASIHDINWPTRREDGTLDIPLLDPPLREAVDTWIIGSIDMFEGSATLPDPTIAAVRLSLDGDLFNSYESARETVTSARLPETTRLMPTQGMLDVLLEYPIQSDLSRFTFHPRFDRFGLRVLTILRYEPPLREVRAFEYAGGDPGPIRLDPTWLQTAWKYLGMGFRHIIDGPDHLLFLLCLVVPLRSVLALAAVAAGFTIAHSVTLIASAYDMAPGSLWFPPLIDTLVAASILYLAIENIIVESPRRRWVAGFAFGLVHGFGFAFEFASQLQFAGSHFLTSLLSFNVGLAFGQIAILLTMVAGLWLLFQFVPERGGAIVLSALVAHTAWHWTMDRYALLSRYPIELPAIDATFLANLMRWLMVFVALAFAYWLMNVVRGKAETAG